MKFWVGDRLVPEDEAVVSVLDRSFLYGDGLFETAPIRAGFVFRWRRHLARLVSSAAALGISFPGGADAIERAAGAVLDANEAADGVLRLHLSRGVGRRGYSPAGAVSPVLIVTLHPPAPRPPSPRLITATWRVMAGDPWAAHKTSSQIGRVMARAEAAERGADDALILNHLGEVAETAGSNVLWIRDGRLVAPPPVAGALPGVTRGALLELAADAGLEPEERTGSPVELAEADAVLVASSTFGPVEAASLDGRPLRRGAGDRLAVAYEKAWGECTERPARVRVG
jgi:branched-chain amino acid aminotransferase